MVTYCSSAVRSDSKLLGWGFTSVAGTSAASAAVWIRNKKAASVPPRVAPPLDICPPRENDGPWGETGCRRLYAPLAGRATGILGGDGPNPCCAAPPRCR